MSVLEQATIGLAVFAGLLIALSVLDVLARWALGPDRDLDGPWDPRQPRG